MIGLEDSKTALNFADEQGTTSELLVITILLSLVLVFSFSATNWMIAKNSDVQTVADVAALSGAKTVGSYYAVVQIMDSILLSLGLLGTLILGLGFVVCCIPSLSGIGVKLTDFAAQVLRARNAFFDEVVSRLAILEDALPSLVMATSWYVTSANSSSKTSYVGGALPFPYDVHSDFGSSKTDVDEKEISQVSGELSDDALKLQELNDDMDEAKKDGWLADCGNEGRSLRERADSLAALSSAENPYYELEDWNFGVPILRGRAYYAKRLFFEGMSFDSPSDITRMKCQSAFFNYALTEMKASTYVDVSSGKEEMDLKALPHDLADLRATPLYTEQLWFKDSANRVHSYSQCPGITGAISKVSLQDIEEAHLEACPVCHMSLDALAKVSYVSTNVLTGYEHWWKKVQEASKRYSDDAEKLDKLKSSVDPHISKSKELFERAVKVLANKRPRMNFPGKYGCVSVVVRTNTEELPSVLTKSFLRGQIQLSRAVAISGAVLTPDTRQDEGVVLESAVRRFVTMVDLPESLSSIGTVWDGILGYYKNGYDSLLAFFDSLPFGLSRTPLARKLKNGLKISIENLGFEPTDVAVYKPSIVKTSQIFKAIGMNRDEMIRKWIQEFPESHALIDISHFFLGKAYQALEKRYLLGGLHLPLSVRPIEIMISLFGGSA